jgi:hypothetical protein
VVGIICTHITYIMVDVKLITEEDMKVIFSRVEALEKRMAEVIEEKLSASVDKDFISVKEFIELIGVSRSTFENMKKEAQPDRFRVDFRKRGRKVFVPYTEVSRFFDQN